jgi:glucokinase
MPASPVILALDAGGTFFKSALVLPSGEILSNSLRSEPVNSQGSAENVIAAYKGVFKNALADSSAAGLRLAAIGVSTPGPFDYVNCTSLMTHKFPAIRGVNLGKALADAMPEIRGLPLRFLSDSHAFILGERQSGAARGHSDVVGVTIGTGVGFGCLAGGRIIDNGKGGPLYAIFKLPCRTGTLEDYVSRSGIIRLFGEKYSRGTGLDVIDIAALARQPKNAPGTGEARAAFNEVGMLLGETLRPIMNDLAPTCLVVGGQISKAFDLFSGELRKSLGASTKLFVSAAQNPDTAALIGAAGAAFGNQS